MKSALKIFLFLISTIILLIGILLITVSLSQNKIVDVALNEISEGLKAPIEVDEVSFTLFKKFPYSTFELSGIRVGHQNSYTGDADSVQNILYIRRAFISVKTRPLFDYKFETVKIELEGANIVYHIDSLGVSNIDFLVQDDSETTPDTSYTEMPFVELKELILKEISIQYSNDSDLTRAKIYAPELFINGQLTSEKYSVQAKGEIQVSNCNIDSTNLYKMEKLSADFSIQYQDDTILIDDLTILSEGAHLNAIGKVAIKEDLFTNVYLKSDGLDLAKLFKYIPQEILVENNIQNVLGLLTFDGKVEGIVNDSILPQLTFRYDFRDGKIITQDYPGIEKLKFSGTYTNGKNRNNATTRVDIQALHLATKNSKVNAKLSLRNLDKPRYVFSSNLNLSLVEFKSQIPDSIAHEVSGKIKASFSTKGTIPDSMDDAFINYVLNHTNADFIFEDVDIKTDSMEMNGLYGKLNYAPGKLIVNDLSISIPDQDLKLNNTSLDASLTGLLTQSNQIGIELHSFNLESPQGKIWGSGSVQNLDYPTFQLNAHSLIHLAEMKPFLPDTLIKNISGDIGAKILTDGKIHLDSISTQITPILLENTWVALSFDDVNITQPDTLMQIKNFSGKLNLFPDTITISDMEGTALGVYFALDSATIANYNTTILKNEYETLKVSGNIALGDINSHSFDALLSQRNNEMNTTSQQDTVQVESINYGIDFKGKFAAKSFHYDHAFIDNLALLSELDDSTTLMLHSYLKNKILVEDISAKINHTDHLTIVEDFTLNAFNGQLKSSLRMWTKDQSKTIFNIKNEVDKMDIKQLLIDVNELGQSGIITSENISGLFSGSMFSRFLIENDSLKQDEIYVSGSFKLDNGGLYNYKPAMEMRKFTGIKELDNIVFKTIETDLFVLSNKVYVPKTHLVSTSFDASIFGMQDLLTEDLEFHPHINLGDVLTGKNPKLFERQEKDGDIVGKKEKERGAVKLVYLQEDGKTKTKFDTKKSQNKMDVQIRLQKGLLGVAFNPYLVSFDTGIE